MVEKILNINIDDENSSKIVEILGNKTCKKILGFIADRESMSEGDLVRELKIPANTLNYNIKKLISAGFIRETPQFFWSVKGKKIKTYKLANKKIIISTKKSFKSLVVSIFGVGIVGFVIKLLSNVYSFNAGSSLEFVNSKFSDTVYTAMPLVARTGQDFIQIISPFQNTLIWFIIGCLIGLIGYLLFKKMKGGKK
jgi:DNA-binding transcriptional ArsR family regulator